MKEFLIFYGINILFALPIIFCIFRHKHNTLKSMENSYIYCYENNFNQRLLSIWANKMERVKKEIKNLKNYFLFAFVSGMLAMVKLLFLLINQ